MLSTLKIRVKILAFWSLFLLSSIFLNFWRLELPNITGTLSIWLAIFNSSSGAFTARRTAGTFGGGGETENNNLASFDASLSSTIYKDINTVQPASNQVLIIIKT